MKAILSLLLIIIPVLSSTSQTKSDSVSLTEKLLVGKLHKDKVEITLDTAKFITLYNNEVYEGEFVIDELFIISAITKGDQQIKYYYLQLSSKSGKVNVARWLFVVNDSLYIDFSQDTDVFTYQDLYITCEGQGDCTPNLFIIGDEYIWGCQEDITKCEDIVEVNDPIFCTTKKTAF